MVKILSNSLVLQIFMGACAPTIHYLASPLGITQIMEKLESTLGSVWWCIGLVRCPRGGNDGVDPVDGGRSLSFGGASDRSGAPTESNFFCSSLNNSLGHLGL